jgi:hypothetical protein
MRRRRRARRPDWPCCGRGDPGWATGGRIGAAPADDCRADIGAGRGRAGHAGPGIDCLRADSDRLHRGTRRTGEVAGTGRLIATWWAAVALAGQPERSDEGQGGRDQDRQHPDQATLPPASPQPGDGRCDRGRGHSDRVDDAILLRELRCWHLSSLGGPATSGHERKWSADKALPTDQALHAGAGRPVTDRPEHDPPAALGERSCWHRGFQPTSRRPRC